MILFATLAVEIHTFWPSTMYRSPFLIARVLICVVLRPAPGSVTPKQALSWPFIMAGSEWRLCSSVPLTTSGLRPKMFMVSQDAPDIPAPDSATVTIMIERSGLPGPTPPTRRQASKEKVGDE